MQMAGVVGIDVLFVAAKEGLDFLYVIFSKEKLVRKVESGSEQADMRHNDDVFLFRLAALLNILLKPRPASAFEIVEIPTFLSGFPGIEVGADEMAIFVVEREILKSHAQNRSRGLLPVVQRFGQVSVMGCKDVVKFLFASGLHFIITDDRELTRIRRFAVLSLGSRKPIQDIHSLTRLYDRLVLITR